MLLNGPYVCIIPCNGSLISRSGSTGRQAYSDDHTLFLVSLSLEEESDNSVNQPIKSADRADCPPRASDGTPYRERLESSVRYERRVHDLVESWCSIPPVSALRRTKSRRYVSSTFLNLIDKKGTIQENTSSDR